jgi:hypothetical protein
MQLILNLLDREIFQLILNALSKSRDYIFVFVST